MGGWVVGWVELYSKAVDAGNACVHLHALILMGGWVGGWLIEWAESPYLDG